MTVIPNTLFIKNDMTSHLHKRDIVYDVMKGFLILLVVIGHTGLLKENNTILFWFHVPCFFMISGALQKWYKIRKGGQKYIANKARAYALPYFAWCLLFYLIFLPESPIKYIGRVIYGGSLNSLIFTYPFWFINALFIGTLVFGFFYWLIEVRRWFIYVSYAIIIAYLFLRYLFSFLQGFELPWSIEIVPYLCIYFVEGIYSNKIISYFKTENKIFLPVVEIICGVIGISLIIFYQFGLFDYVLNVKDNAYSCFWGDIFIPIIFFFFIRLIAFLLSKIPLLEYLFVLMGRNSMTIMFTHAALFCIPSILGLNTPIVKAIFAIVVGVLIGETIGKNKYLTLLFTGKLQSKLT